MNAAISIAWQQAIASIRVRKKQSVWIVLGIVFGMCLASFSYFRYLGAISVDSRPQTAERALTMAIVAALLTAVGSANSLILSIAERTREFGSIRCLGAPTSLVALIAFLEAVVLALPAVPLGVLLGAGITEMSGQAASFGAGIFATVIGLGFCAVSTVGPVWAALTVSPIDALRAEV